MAVWICQCLCPDRHCILATADEAENEDEASRLIRTPLRRKVIELLRDGTLNPWCALCDAQRATWRYELRRTAFASLAEALPALRAIEAENVATNRVWGDLHKTRPN